MAILACLGLPARAVLTQARPADEFVDSVGVGVGSLLNYDSGTGTFPDFTVLESRIKAGGFRFVRLPHNTLHLGGAASVAKAKQLIADTGVKVVYTIDPPTGTRPDATYWAGTATPANVVDYLDANFDAGDIWAVEMCNEIDNFYGPYKWHPGDTANLNNTPTSPYYWGKYILAATPSVQAALASSGVAWISDLPLIGPSLISHGDYTYVGDLSASVDAGCIHPYTSYYPENGGYGGYFYNYKYGSMEENVFGFGANCQAPGQPPIATEGGNTTTPNAASTNGAWTWTTQGKYLPRLYLKLFQLGCRATCVYTLNDFANAPSNSEDNYGLLDYQFNPKPAYTFIKNLTNLLKDPGTSFQPDSIDVGLSGSTANVHTQLFQKANGYFYLCLWLAVSRQDPNTGAAQTVTPQAVTVTVPSVVAGAEKYVFDDSGNMTTSAALWGSGGTFALTVTDAVTVLKFSSTLAHTGTPQIYQPERLRVAARSQAYEAFPDAGATEGNCARLKGAGVGDYVVYAVPNVKAATYASVDLRYRKSPAGGKIQLQVSNAATGPWTSIGSAVDTYSAAAGYGDMTASNVAFPTPAGTKYFRVVDAAANPSGTYTIEADQLTLSP